MVSPRFNFRSLSDLMSNSAVRLISRRTSRVSHKATERPRRPIPRGAMCLKAILARSAVTAVSAPETSSQKRSSLISWSPPASSTKRASGAVVFSFCAATCRKASSASLTESDSSNSRRSAMALTLALPWCMIVLHRFWTFASSFPALEPAGGALISPSSCRAFCSGSTASFVFSRTGSSSSTVSFANDPGLRGGPSCFSASSAAEDASLIICVDMACLMSATAAWTLSSLSCAFCIRPMTPRSSLSSSPCACVILKETCPCVARSLS
mmetsp:Transcript_50865/g.114364  ORF Transcript_50865/g.114364 Transcript_50865/m.114364 type:complete len:268 (+) Transcript_50865:1228-2031(+)